MRFDSDEVGLPGSDYHRDGPKSGAGWFAARQAQKETAGSTKDDTDDRGNGVNLSTLRCLLDFVLTRAPFGQ